VIWKITGYQKYVQIAVVNILLSRGLRGVNAAVNAKKRTRKPASIVKPGRKDVRCAVRIGILVKISPFQAGLRPGSVFVTTVCPTLHQREGIAWENAKIVSWSITVDPGWNLRYSSRVRLQATRILC
jgi:hypothetical protein